MNDKILRDVARAEAHFREAELRVTRQERLVADLALHGHERERAMGQQLLDALRALLVTMGDFLRLEREHLRNATPSP